MCSFGGLFKILLRNLLKLNFFGCFDSTNGLSHLVLIMIKMPWKLSFVQLGDRYEGDVMSKCDSLWIFKRDVILRVIRGVFIQGGLNTMPPRRAMLGPPLTHAINYTQCVYDLI